MAPLPEERKELYPISEQALEIVLAIPDSRQLVAEEADFLVETNRFDLLKWIHDGAHNLGDEDASNRYVRGAMFQHRLFREQARIEKVELPIIKSSTLESYWTEVLGLKQQQSNLALAKGLLESLESAGLDHDQAQNLVNQTDQVQDVRNSFIGITRALGGLIMRTEPALAGILDSTNIAVVKGMLDVYYPMRLQQALDDQET